MKKRLFLILYIIFIILSCKKNIREEEVVEFNDIPNHAKNIGVVFNSSGLDDKSFNDILLTGLIEADKKLSIILSYRIASSDEEKSFLSAVNELVVEKKCELIIMAGFYAKKPLMSISPRFPETKFVILDEELKGLKNVSSVIFSQDEGAFVAGFIASRISKTKKIGFIGGINIPVIDSFLSGFKQGLDYSLEDSQLFVEYCSLKPDMSGFSNVERAYNIADSMYNNGVDIIFSVAGESGIGVIQAATSNKKFVIGVDSNQDYLSKGLVITSVMKRLDNAVFDMVKLYLNGELISDYTYNYGYKNNGVSITDMKYTKHIFPQRILNEIKTIEKELSLSNISVKK